MAKVIDNRSERGKCENCGTEVIKVEPNFIEFADEAEAIQHLNRVMQLKEGDICGLREKTGTRPIIFLDYDMMHHRVLGMSWSKENGYTPVTSPVMAVEPSLS